MNALGASLACVAAALIGFYPFVVLEGSRQVHVSLTRGKRGLDGYQRGLSSPSR